MITVASKPMAIPQDWRIEVIGSELASREPGGPNKMRPIRMPCTTTYHAPLSKID
jgi:hypothetical protein